MPRTTPRDQVIADLTASNARLARAVDGLQIELAAIRDELTAALRELATARGESFRAPTTPSGQQPPFVKATAPARRRPLGRPQGAPGARRPPPTEIDCVEVHTLKRCPCCGGKVQTLHGKDGRPIYRVRWQAANGQRIDFIVDATTGAIIGRN